jgi:hypothetical protein
MQGSEVILPAWISAGIFKQSRVARNRVGIGLLYRPAMQATHSTQPVGIGSLESILGPLKGTVLRDRFRKC